MTNIRGQLAVLSCLLQGWFTEIFDRSVNENYYLDII